MGIGVAGSADVAKTTDENKIASMIEGRTEIENSGQGQLSAHAVVRTFNQLDEPLALDDRRVDIWVCEMAQELRQDLTGQCLSHLSTAEQQRAAQFVMPRVREQFVVGRSVLRRLLARYLSCDISAITISTQDNGKPILVNNDANLHFNLAHSNGWVVVAVARRPVGVDLEVVRDVANAEGLINRFFAGDEQQQFHALPAERKRDAFLRGWICKEAVLKATGDGMRAVDRCSVCLDPTKPPRLIRYAGRPSEESWGLGAWVPVPDMVAAVAVQGVSQVVIA
ncbi:MAG: 4'-phosphopantetheinyl transferase superfamily protein [Gemmataceae bacterium]